MDAVIPALIIVGFLGSVVALVQTLMSAAANRKRRPDFAPNGIIASRYGAWYLLSLILAVLTLATDSLLPVVFLLVAILLAIFYFGGEILRRLPRID